MSYTERPTQIVETPFGPMRATFLSADHISLRDTSDDRYTQPTGEPITVNGVQYRASFNYELKNGAWVETYRSLDRAQWRGKAYDYSPAALRKVREALPQIVEQIANKQTDTLRAAQIASLTDAHTRAKEKADKLRADLAEADAEVRRLSGELAVLQADIGS